VPVGSRMCPSGQVNFGFFCEFCFAGDLPCLRLVRFPAILDEGAAGASLETVLGAVYSLKEVKIAKSFANGNFFVRFGLRKLSNSQLELR
jgi:hypothetical protein